MTPARGCRGKISTDSIQSIKPFTEKLQKADSRERPTALKAVYNVDKAGLFWWVLTNTTLASTKERMFLE